MASRAAASPRRPSRVRYARASLVVLVLALLGILIANGSIDVAPEHHGDGFGPLASLGATGSGFYPQSGPTAVTAGIRLCLMSGLEPAVLDGSVAPASSVQGGLRYLGAYVRQGVPAAGFMPLGSIAGFPPPYPYDQLHQEKGFSVNTPCSDGSNPGAPYTELDIGLAPEPDAPGGGWMSVDVGYNAGLRHHVVTLNYDFFYCGAGAPPRYCPRLVTPSPAG